MAAVHNETAARGDGGAERCRPEQDSQFSSPQGHILDGASAWYVKVQEAPAELDEDETGRPGWHNGVRLTPRFRLSDLEVVWDIPARRAARAAERQLARGKFLGSEHDAR